MLRVAHRWHVIGLAQCGIITSSVPHLGLLLRLGDQTAHGKFIRELTSVRQQVAEIMADPEGPTIERLDEIKVGEKSLAIVVHELRDFCFLEQVWLPFSGTSGLY